MSTKDSAIASRGQVFYYNPLWGVFGRNKEPKNITYNGSLECKTRPHLVVSTDKGNFSSSTCNLMPITTRDDTAIPSQVKFRYDGRNQVILTEQPCTANIKDLGEYMYTVSDEVLTQLQGGMRIQFEIDSKTPEMTLELLTQKLEACVDKVITTAKAKAVTVSQSHIEELAFKLGAAVEDLMPVVTEQPVTEVKQQVITGDITPTEPPRAEKPVVAAPPELPKKPLGQSASGMSQIDKFNKRFGKPTTPDPQPADDEPVKKGRKAAWDVETQKQFLKDCETLTPEQVLTKYGFENKKAIYNHKYLIKNRLEKAGETL